MLLDLARKHFYDLLIKYQITNKATKTLIDLQFLEWKRSLEEEFHKQLLLTLFIFSINILKAAIISIACSFLAWNQ